MQANDLVGERNQSEEWQPIVGIDTSVWQYDPVRHKNIIRNDYQDAAGDAKNHQDNYGASDILVFHKSFDVEHNNEIATKQLRLQFNTSV